MNPLERATGLLRRTEVDLRKLVSEAASAGDYTSVVHLAALARSLSEILDPASAKARRSASQPRSPSTALEATSHLSNSRIRSRPSNGYPKFWRQGDRLVRVAWSKGEKREYEQKAPFTVLEALSAVIAEKGSDGRVFRTDELLPIYDEDAAEVPGYQVYAGIALLKQVGLIDQHGRQGYSVPRPPEFKHALEAVWKSLPEK